MVQSECHHSEPTAPLPKWRLAKTWTARKRRRQGGNGRMVASSRRALNQRINGPGRFRECNRYSQARWWIYRAPTFHARPEFCLSIRRTPSASKHPAVGIISSRPLTLHFHARVIHPRVSTFRPALQLFQGLWPDSLLCLWSQRIYVARHTRMNIQTALWSKPRIGSLAENPRCSRPAEI